MRDPGSDSSRPGVSASTIAGVLVILVALGGGACVALAPPAQPEVSDDAGDASGDGAALEAEELGADTGKPGPSAARRAWDAAVNEGRATSPTAATAPLSDSPATFEDVVGRVMPAVVLVEASGGRGSAFFVSADTLFTNVHVVGDDSEVTLRRVDGSTTLARVDSRTPAFDIAVLKVPNPMPDQPVIAMGSAKALRVGQDVFMVGSALGTLQNSVTRGIVSGLRRSGDTSLVQTDAAANPGNSGGPLMDRFGTAVGITTMGYTKQQGITFAVAIDHAKSILDGRVRPTAGAAKPAWEAGALAPATTVARPAENGAQLFTASLTDLAQAADRLDRDWAQFREACYLAPINGSFEREWFALFSPAAMPAPLTPSCNAFAANLRSNANRFKDAMRDALESARRASVAPGHVRDALRTHQLQFDGWDR